MDEERSTQGALTRKIAALRRLGFMQPLNARAEEAEDELALFFAQSLDLLCVAGFDGYFKRLNPAWTAGLGWAPEELMARPFIDFVHPDDRAATLAEVDTLGDGVETIILENRYRHKDGTYRWLRWNARPEQGRERIYATAQDVTQQKHLEKQILEIADREKERLGRELHDGLCQTLAGISALSATLAKNLVAKSELTASSAATEIADLLNEAIGEARDLARWVCNRVVLTRRSRLLPRTSATISTSPAPSSAEVALPGFAPKASRIYFASRRKQ